MSLRMNDDGDRAMLGMEELERRSRHNSLAQTALDCMVQYAKSWHPVRLAWRNRP
jgi:hypothetical protein